MTGLIKSREVVPHLLITDVSSYHSKWQSGYSSDVSFSHSFWYANLTEPFVIIMLNLLHSSGMKPVKQKRSLQVETSPMHSRMLWPTTTTAYVSVLMVEFRMTIIYNTLQVPMTTSVYSHRSAAQRKRRMILPSLCFSLSKVC
jgi:hypothetical protein